MMDNNKPVDNPSSPGVTENKWRSLRRFTDARIGGGRAGVSLPTRELLAFQLAHAQAQDAVHLPLDVAALQRQLIEQQLADDEGVLLLQSQAEGRDQYLQRPDLGRRLSVTAQQRLRQECTQDYDLAVVLVDGLSSLAVTEHAVALLKRLSAALNADTLDWQLAPVTVVEQGRVAVGDEVGELLQAKAVLVMIGERPGLSSPDSLGLYLTWAPEQGLSDARRNCISNVRAAGLSYENAVKKLMYLLQESRRRQLSGVELKERTEPAALASTSSPERLE